MFFTNISSLFDTFMREFRYRASNFCAPRFFTNLVFFHVVKNRMKAYAWLSGIFYIDVPIFLENVMKCNKELAKDDVRRFCADVLKQAPLYESRFKRNQTVIVLYSLLLLWIIESILIQMWIDLTPLDAFLIIWYFSTRTVLRTSI